MAKWGTNGRYRLPSGRTFILLSVDYDRSVFRLMWTHLEHIGNRHEDVPAAQVEDAVLYERLQ